MQMNPPATTGTSRETMRRHLGNLAEELTRNGLLAELVGAISKPYLTVALAAIPSQSERVLCQLDGDGRWSYWWPWEQPIGAVDDLDLVMSRILAVLRSVEVDE